MNISRLYWAYSWLGFQTKDWHFSLGFSAPFLLPFPSFFSAGQICRHGLCVCWFPASLAGVLSRLSGLSPQRSPPKILVYLSVSHPSAFPSRRYIFWSFSSFESSRKGHTDVINSSREMNGKGRISRLSQLISAFLSESGLVGLAPPLLSLWGGCFLFPSLFWPMGKQQSSEGIPDGFSQSSNNLICSIFDESLALILMFPHFLLYNSPLKHLVIQKFEFCLFLRKKRQNSLFQRSK